MNIGSAIFGCTIWISCAVVAAVTGKVEVLGIAAGVTALYVVVSGLC